MCFMVNYGLISLTGKATYLLVHAYNMYPLFERGIMVKIVHI